MGFTVHNSKEFIKLYLIDEVKDIVFRHPYLSFVLMAVGIEFLGKCTWTDQKEWDVKPEDNNKAFEKGLNLMIEIDQRYAGLDLKNQLRNGFAHTLLPKSEISLSEVNAGDEHFGKDFRGRTILVAEIFYRDFVIACKKVLNMQFSESDKMNKPFMEVGN